MSLLPEMWPLHKVAKELGKASHVLVTAARNGTFPPVVKVGAVWFVEAEKCRDWFSRNHAADDVSPADRDRIRQAGRAASGQPPARRLRQPRGHTSRS